MNRYLKRLIISGFLCGLIVTAEPHKLVSSDAPGQATSRLTTQSARRLAQRQVEYERLCVMLEEHDPSLHQQFKTLLTQQTLQATNKKALAVFLQSVADSKISKADKGAVNRFFKRGLSRGARIGIGIGSGVGIAALIVAAAVTLFKNRRSGVGAAGGGAGMGAGAGVVREPRLAADERALLVACENGHGEIARVLLIAGVEVNVTDARGSTPLHLACANGHRDIARVLLDRGAEVNVKDEYGNTSLHGACENGHRDVARVLVEHGAEVNVVNNLGYTPLYWACWKGHVDVVRELLDRGVEVNVVNTGDQTAAQLARDYGHPDVAALIAAEVAARTRRWNDLRAGWCGAVVQGGWVRRQAAAADQSHKRYRKR